MLIHYIIIAVVLLTVQVSLAWEPRIINGESATPHQYPYQAAIFLSIPPIIINRIQCSGVIISPDWILTAGQCVPKIGKLIVKVGKHYLSHEETGEQDREVIQMIKHTNYVGPILNTIPAKNDLALLKLDESLILDEEYVEAINLPEASQVPSGSANLTGWGSVSQNLWPLYPQQLQSVELSIIDTKSCAAAINAASIRSKNWLNIDITENQTCTGALGVTSGACTGDTGSPLVQLNENDNSTELIGIVSWYRYPCGKAGVPTVYTRVSEYVSWINATITTF